MLFLTALGVVGTMLLYAVPGFLLVKGKLVKQEQISAFARLLMYVSSPCLVYTSITRNEFSGELVIQMLIAFAAFFVLLLGIMLAFYFLFRKKRGDVKYRIYSVAVSLANGGFMGVPIVEALFPNYPKAVAFSAMYSLAMNIIGWSVASYIISQDKKYIRPKKILLNPATIALVLAIPFFAFSFSLPPFINDAVSLLGKLSAPLCMLIMGMRLACASPRQVFLKPSQYIIIAIKQLLVPLITFLILMPLPLEYEMKCAIYIIMACPVASVVLNFAEMIGKGQERAASLVLLGTTLSAVTVPIMSLLI